MSQELEMLFDEYGLKDQFLLVNECSPYVIQVLEKQQQKLSRSLDTAQWGLMQAPTIEDMIAFSDQEQIDQLSEPQFKSLLRQFRNFHSAKIIWHELNNLLDWRALFRLQSNLADVCMQAALQYVDAEFAKQYHALVDAEGKEMQLGVIAMGKWGGEELNFSSDIDYIYVFSENGEVNKLSGSRALSHQEFFTKQAQKINQILDDVTLDGFVYRCDTRLRPFGDSGPLVVSLSAMEQYLVEHGREWERYAYLKARCVTGDDAVRSGFEDIRRPFVYRRYLDYGVFANLRDMHDQISEQVKKKQIKDDIKLGRGGIRECEFLVQSYQLIRGGRDTDLQQANFYDAYLKLANEKILQDVDQEFLDAYIFHRMLENRLQALHQEQTHSLPSNERDRHALVKAMKMTSWEYLLETWEQHRSVVEKKFNQHVQLFKLDTEKESNSYLARLNQQIKMLCEGVEAGDTNIQSELTSFKEAAFYRRLRDSKKRLVDQVLIQYFSFLNREWLAERFNASDLIELNQRFMRIIAAIGQRQTYFSLLAEHSLALENLVNICAKSGFISLQVSQNPILLDELLDARIFKNVPTMTTVRDEVLLLGERIEQLDTEDFLQQLVIIKNVQIFRIALADVTGNLSLMKVSDCLTVLAESILSVVLDFVNLQTLRKLNLPVMDWRDAGFSIVAYGKLGGLELAYSSDLDIVFLFDEGQIDLEHPLSKDKVVRRQYYHRLAQQCIRILDMPTLSGRLYEVDTRLRPSGNSGFLVSSFDAYEKYQKNDAWIWEHQALTRARAILGSDNSIQHFEHIRKEILIQKNNQKELQSKVLEMRERMRQELDTLADKNLFHLKHSKGGMIDIEFLVQYLILANAHKTSSLVQFSDNVRQLESIVQSSRNDKAILENAEANDLVRIYLSLRAKAHILGLDNKSAIIPAADILQDRNRVIQLWEKYLLSDI